MKDNRQKSAPQKRTAQSKRAPTDRGVPPGTQHSPRPAPPQKNRQSSAAKPAARGDVSRPVTKKKPAPRAVSKPSTGSVRRSAADTHAKRKPTVAPRQTAPVLTEKSGGSASPKKTASVSASAKTSGVNSRSRKKAIIAIIIAAIVAVGAIVGIIIGVRSCKKDDDPNGNTPPIEGLQNISYKETLEYIANPDQGFYRPAFVKMTESGATCSKPLYAETQLYHLRVDISAFSTAAGGRDGQITQAALDGLESVIEFYESNGRNIIIRFAYDPGFGGKSDVEPSIDLMLDHVRAFSVVLNRHLYALTAIETGMVGPWGEMHTSTAANTENIVKLADEFLKNVSDAPVLVRTPKMIYAYLGITLGELDGYAIPNDPYKKRIGLYNDGYLGSETDLGTYTDCAVETKWLGDNVTNRLPYGGEVVVPDSKLHDINKCTVEMFAMNLSYLNYEWHYSVVQDKWVKTKYTAAAGGDKLYYGQSAYTYIRNRLGYRLVVRSSIFDADEENDVLEIKLDIENVGFGNLDRAKKARVVFADGEGAIAASEEIGEYDGGGRIDAKVSLPSASGKYGVYFMLYSGEEASPVYPVAFANAGMYDAELAANRIGAVEIPQLTA